MPISIQVSQGLLTSQGEREVFGKVADALLDVHGLRGNSFMAPVVIGHLDIYPEGHSFADGRAQSLAARHTPTPH